MKLTTLLNAKKAARKLVFYGYWSPQMKQAMKTALNRMLFQWQLSKQGIKIENVAGAISFSKNGRRILVDLQTGSDPEQALSIAKNFDHLFSIPELRTKNGTIDFTGEISLMGYAVRTNFGMVLELSGMRDYNKHYKIKEGDIVFDCGAFHGIYALTISRQVGENGRIYCFEPDEKNSLALQANLGRNLIKNVTIVKKGMWKNEGKMSFVQGKEATSSIAFSGQADIGPIQINVTSIPAFFKSQNLSKLGFVKMDIEGAEIEVVEGCLDFIKSHRVNFAIASYHLRDGQETYHALEPLFRGAGYEVKTEVTDTITTYAGPKNSSEK